MRLGCFVSWTSRSEDGLAVVWNQCSVSALMPLREERCGSHSEDLCVCVPTVHSEHSASEDVCICVRQTHVFICV